MSPRPSPEIPITIPDFVTHYHLSDRSPFLSLSDLQESELHQVLLELREKAKRGETKRGFASWYVEERKKTESFLRSEFIYKGGKPEREFPLYFVLGESKTQKSMDPAQAELKLALNEFPKDVISFTYPDSMATMVLANDPEYYEPFHGKVFTYDEIIQVVKEYGFPKDEAGKTSKFLYPKYIEMQLWSNGPIKRHLL